MYLFYFILFFVSAQKHRLDLLLLCAKQYIHSSGQIPKTVELQSKNEMQWKMANCSISLLLSPLSMIQLCIILKNALFYTDLSIYLFIYFISFFLMSF